MLRAADDDRGAEREARLLDTLAPHLSIAIPTPRFVDPDAGVLAYELIAGRPLLGRSVAAGAARRLSRFLRELHAVEPATVEHLVDTDDADPNRWLEELAGPAGLAGLVHASRPRRTLQRVVAHRAGGSRLRNRHRSPRLRGERRTQLQMALPTRLTRPGRSRTLR